MSHALLESVPRKLPRQERSRAMVDAILDAAARILVTRGRDAATTNSIAMLAGASIGSLYQYFPNREAILAAVAHRHAHRIRQCVLEVEIDKAETLAQGLRALIGGLFAAHAIDPQLHLALDHDIGHGKNVRARNDRTPVGSKSAICEKLGALPPPVRAEITASNFTLAIEIVAEIVDALSRRSLRSADPSARARVECEAVRAALHYLRGEHRAL